MALLKRTAAGFILAARPSACVATIGNFDGLHLGHQALLAELDAAGARTGLARLCISFEPLSHEHFRPGGAFRVMGWRDKLQQLRACPVDYALTLSFNDNLSSLSARAFLDKYLLGWNARAVIVGHDFCFGHKRTGDVQFLQAYGREHGIDVRVLEPVLDDAHERASSSALRQLLAAGDLARAALMLGRDYSLIGRVRGGRRLGRELGFPTANLALSNKNPPLRGVYAARVRVLGSAGSEEALCSEGHWAAVNIGKRPSLDDGDTKLYCEAHLLDFDGDLYGRWLQLSFREFIRAERKFANLSELSEQIGADVARVRGLVGEG